MSIKKIIQFKDKHAPKGSFKANVLTLMIGTSIAQAIPIAAAPILTRLYTPADFGVFALYLSITAIIGIVATGRYELAIMLPEKDEDAVNLVALSILIACGVSVVTLLVVWIFNVPIAKLLGNPAISPWLYFIPLSVFLTGAFQAFNYWSTRKKQYKRLAIRQVTQLGVMITTQTGLGAIHVGTGGMVAGQIVGQTVATGLFARNILIEDGNKFKWSISGSLMSLLLRKYVNFPKFDIPASFINVLSNQAPTILLSVFFNPEVVGFYALTQRVLTIPISLIANSILGVFKQRASKDYLVKGNCKQIYLKTLKSLTFFSFVPFACLFLFAPQFFTFIFGSQWKVAGEYAQLLSPLFFFRFMSSPLSFVLYIAEKQSVELTWQIFLLIGTFISMFVGIAYHNPKISIILFSITYSFLYLVYLCISYFYSKGPLYK